MFGSRYICLTCKDKTGNHEYGSNWEYAKTWKMTFWLTNPNILVMLIFILTLPCELFSKYILGKERKFTNFLSSI